MRSWFVSAFIAGFIFSAGCSFAVTNGDIDGINTAPEITEVICEVTDIKGDTLEVKDTIGETYELKAGNPNALGEFKIGDNAYVEIKDGRAVSIQKIQSTSDM